MTPARVASVALAGLEGSLVPTEISIRLGRQPETA
jgi:hypothetical protein